MKLLEVDGGWELDGPLDGRLTSFRALREKLAQQCLATSPFVLLLLVLLVLLPKKLRQEMIIDNRCGWASCYHAWCRSLWNSSLATVPQPPARVCSSEVVVAVAATLHDPAQTHLIHVLRQAVQRGDGGGGDDADEGGTGVAEGLPSSRLRRCLRSRATNQLINLRSASYKWWLMSPPESTCMQSCIAGAGGTVERVRVFMF
uniref:Uncharacterized protein n=1 Tax=Anopheles merus TaxID=30066 RepID=A0A182VKH9_ANOME